MAVSRLLAALLCWLVFLSAALLHGQNPDCRERTFVASVVDRFAVLKGLTKENFQINYRWHNLTPRNVTYSEGPRRVIMLLDVSRGMQGKRNSAKWEIAVRAARGVATALPPGSKLGLIAFSSQSQILAPLSADCERIAGWLNSKTLRDIDVVKGRTALYDGIQSAIQQLQPTEPGDAIYVISDAGDKPNKALRSIVEEELVESGVRVFGLIFPSSQRNASRDVDPEDELGVLSDDSGGFLQPWGFDPDMRRVVDETEKQLVKLHTSMVSLQMSAFYSLTVELPEDPHKSRHWEVRIVNSGKLHQNARVGYPLKVPPCQMMLGQK
jgi:hypothetical protein